MANRSYLYVADFDPSGDGPRGQIKALSEWNWSIPISHRILAGANARMCRSQAWDGDALIAVCGDFAAGREALFGFLSQLRMRDLLPEKELYDAIAETHAALDRHTADGLFTLLEAAEITSMLTDDGRDLEALTEETVFSELCGPQEFPALLDHLAEVASSKGVNSVWNELGIQHWCDLTWLGVEQVNPPPADGAQSVEGAQVMDEAQAEPIVEAEPPMSLEDKAKMGDVEAMYQLGRAYAGGSGGYRRNEAEAFRWYLAAAEAGHVLAQVGVGYRYQQGLGVEVDLKAAVEWARRAAEQGNSDGQYNLGLYYRDGTGVNQDLALAYYWLHRSAEQGDGDAEAAVGRLCEDGRGVEQDVPAAVTWYRKSAEHGNVYGQSYLADMYYGGIGVEQDFVEARKWYEKAAKAGRAWSNQRLGFIWHAGEGVPSDDQLALHYFLQAAKGELVVAMTWAGFLYEKGQEIPHDLDKARLWYRRASDKGHSDATYRLGMTYEESDKPEDRAEAIRLFRLAMTQEDNDDAARHLAQMLAQPQPEPSIVIPSDSIFARPNVIDIADKIRVDGAAFDFTSDGLVSVFGAANIDGWKWSWDKYGIVAHVIGQGHIRDLQIALTGPTRWTGEVRIDGHMFSDFANLDASVGAEGVRIAGSNFLVFLERPGRTTGSWDDDVLIEVRLPPGIRHPDPDKCRVPECAEPCIVFLNPTFKYAIVDDLMYRQKVLTPAFDVEEFADAYPGRDIDPEWEGEMVGIIPEVADWFWRLPVPLSMAPLVTQISFDGGYEIYGQLWPFWDGESDEFVINAEAAELDQFPNVTRLRDAYQVTPATLELARSRGWDIGEEGAELVARRAAAFQRCQTTPSPQTGEVYCLQCQGFTMVTGTPGLSEDRCDVELTGVCSRCGQSVRGRLR